MAPSLISGGDDEPTRPAALTVAELTRNHTGKRVRIEHEHPDPWAVEGKLYQLHHEGETLEVVGYGNVVQFTATVVEKPGTTTTLIRTNDTGRTMLVSNHLLRKKAT